MKTAEIYLHTSAQGTLWLGMPGQEPDIVEGGAIGFIAEHRDKPGKMRIKVLGDQCNATLLVELMACFRGTEVEVLVGSPARAREAGTIEFGDAAIRTAIQLEIPASAGGWRKTNDYDLIPYFFAGRLSGVQPQTYQNMLHSHPAYLVGSFFEGFDWEATRDLIAEILDPRWFEEPDQEQGLKRNLNSFFGLKSPKEWSKRFAADGCRNAAACRGLLLCKAFGLPHQSGTEYFSGNGGPASWLRIMWIKDSSGGFHTARVTLDLLTQVWLDVVTGGRYDLFSGVDFFQNEAMANAFQEHRLRLVGVDIPGSEL